MVEKGIKSKELVAYIVAKWERLKRERTDKERTWDECISAYMSQILPDSDVKNFRSQRPQPNAFEAVENVSALLGVGLFPNGQFCMAVGENPEAEFAADKRTRFMHNRLERMQYTEKYVGQHIKQLLILGNSPRLIKWSQKQSRRREGSDEFMGTAYRKSAYDFDGPDFDVLDMFNFVMDPKVSDIDSKVKIYRLKVSVGDLLADADDGIYDKKAVQRAIDGGGGSKPEPSDSDEEARFQAFGFQAHKKESDDDEVELLWCHGDFPVGAKGKREVLRDRIVVIANRSELIRCEENPLDCGHSPLRFTTLIPVVGSSYGLGLLETNLGLIDLLNVLPNQAIDAGALNLNGMWAYRDGSLDPNDLVAKPGGGVPMENPNEDIKSLVPSLDFLQIYSIVGGFKQEFVDATFSWKSAGAQKEQTATASAITANLQGSVMRRLSQRLENTDIEPDLKMFDEMEQQFYEPNAEQYPFARFEQDGTQKYEQITPDVIYQDYTWKCNGSGEAQFRQLQQQGHFQWMLTMAQSPAVGSVDWEEAGKESLRLMGHRAIDRLMPGLEKMMQKNLAAIQMQQWLAGAAQIPPGSMPPEGMPPGGRGPVPNAGGAANFNDAITRVGGMQREG